MPTQQGILGFANRWYPDALRLAEPFTPPGCPELRLITAPLLVATKLEAFKSRGDGDMLASHDLEDIISLFDGRPELVDEVLVSHPPLQEYLESEFSRLLADPDFIDAIPAHLPADSASKQRVPLIIERLERARGKT